MDDLHHLRKRWTRLESWPRTSDLSDLAKSNSSRNPNAKPANPNLDSSLYLRYFKYRTRQIPSAEGDCGTMTVAISSEFKCLQSSRIRVFPRSSRTARPQRKHIAAAYNPAWGPVPSGNSTPLHGVLHSSQLPPTLAETVGMYDARDAIEACSGLYGEEKAACFAIFGVDGEAERWYDTVFRLETALELETGRKHS